MNKDINAPIPNTIAKLIKESTFLLEPAPKADSNNMNKYPDQFNFLI